jgi:hypothetical protein
LREDAYEATAFPSATERVRVGVWIILNSADNPDANGADESHYRIG